LTAERRGLPEAVARGFHGKGGRPIFMVLRVGPRET